MTRLDGIEKVLALSERFIFFRERSTSRPERRGSSLFSASAFESLWSDTEVVDVVVSVLFREHIESCLTHFSSPAWANVYCAFCAELIGKRVPSDVAMLHFLQLSGEKSPTSSWFVMDPLQGRRLTDIA